MMADCITVRDRPCSTCPYRKDVPSGLWARKEYERLLKFDGTTFDQANANATQPLYCHTDITKLCAGWVGCHDMDENLALRFLRERVCDWVYHYVSPVPLFSSGREAYEHGIRELYQPGKRAQRMIRVLQRKIARRPKEYQ
jgi:Family of unknown function (DUF6283)